MIFKRLMFLAHLAPAASFQPRLHGRAATSAGAAVVPHTATPPQMATLRAPKKIFVLGGDGFCGWPTALDLSDAGHEVVIIDNLSRRKVDLELGCSSLTPIQTPETRVVTWNKLSGNRLQYVHMDLAREYDSFLKLLCDEKPDTIVHFAEQRAAPYSMKNAACKRWAPYGNHLAKEQASCPGCTGTP